MGRQAFGKRGGRGPGGMLLPCVGRSAQHKATLEALRRRLLSYVRKHAADFARTVEVECCFQGDTTAIEEKHMIQKGICSLVSNHITASANKVLAIYSALTST